MFKNIMIFILKRKWSIMCINIDKFQKIMCISTTLACFEVHYLTITGKIIKKSEKCQIFAILGDFFDTDIFLFPCRRSQSKKLLLKLLEDSYSYKIMVNSSIFVTNCMYSSQNKLLFDMK